jgi:hypothetical protein
MEVWIVILWSCASPASGVVIAGHGDDPTVRQRGFSALSILHGPSTITAQAGSLKNQTLHQIKSGIYY